MSNEFTLDSLREELENEYRPMVIEAEGTTYTLRSLLRVDKTVREAVVERLNELNVNNETNPNATVDANDLDEDSAVEAIKFVLASVVEGTQAKGKAFVRTLGNDLPLLMKVMAKWQEATQPGEASGSPA